MGKKRKRRSNGGKTHSGDSFCPVTVDELIAAYGGDEIALLQDGHYEVLDELQRSTVRPTERIDEPDRSPLEVLSPSLRASIKQDLKAVLREPVRALMEEALEELLDESLREIVRKVPPDEVRDAESSEEIPDDDIPF